MSDLEESDKDLEDFVKIPRPRDAQLPNGGKRAALSAQQRHDFVRANALRNARRLELRGVSGRGLPELQEAGLPNPSASTSKTKVSGGTTILQFCR